MHRKHIKNGVISRYSDCVEKYLQEREHKYKFKMAETRTVVRE